MTNQYLTLIRGINVGGNNIIKMIDLKTSFESFGFTDVVTYIQSGNVIFKSENSDKHELTNIIEAGLSKRFSFDCKIVLITFEQMEAVISKAPDGFGEMPEEYRYDVLFLKEPLLPKDAVKDLKLREGIDAVYEGKSVIYFSRLISQAGQSYMNKIITMPIYKQMTIRNWNTTNKLYALMKK